MIRFHELVFGYENVARLQMEKGNYVNAKEQLRKALRTVKKEKFTESEKREVLSTLDKIFEDYMKMEEPSSCLDTIEAIKVISDGKVDVRKYGIMFVDKFSKAADYYQYEPRLKELVPDIADGVQKYETPITQKIVYDGTKVANNEQQNYETVVVNADLNKSNEIKSEFNNKLNDKILLARQELGKGNKDLSLKIVMEILTENPDYSEAKDLLNMIRKKEEEEKVENIVNEALSKMNVSDERIRETLKLAFQNEYDKANDFITKEIAKDRNNAELWLVKAYIVRKLGNQKLAENFESFSKKLNPSIVKTKIYAELSKL